MASTALYTDRYELTMLDAALTSGVAERRAVFEVFARSLPPGRRYGVFAGLGRLLPMIEQFRFGDDELDFLEAERVVSGRAVEWLAEYRFSGSIDAYAEGECFFPGSPVITLEGTFGEAVLLETLVLSVCNFDSAVAGAASRMVGAAAGRPVIEMGARRTSEEAAVAAARAAYLAGFASTSNLEAGRRFGVPTTGTAAHAFVLAHEDERAAFAAQLDVMGVATTLLVDTYDTPRAIRIAVELARERGAPGPGAIRLDSGDLVVEARRARELLDDLGAHETGIVITSDLDEYAIEALAGTPTDAYGVGSRVVTGSGAPTASFVYKLVAIGESHDPSSSLRPVEKLSPSKHSLGSRKRAVRWVDDEGMARVELLLADGAPEEATDLPEGWQTRELQHRVMENGRSLAVPGLLEAREHHRWSVRELGAEAFDLSPGQALLPTRYAMAPVSAPVPEERVALVVVDVQKDLCEGGSVAIDGGEAVAQAIADRIAARCDRYAAVVATRDWHVNPGRHFAVLAEAPDFVTSWPVHCVAGSDGAELHPALARIGVDAIFSKGEQEAAYSAFEGHDEAGTPLGSWLADRGIEQIEVCGLATDYSVRATVLDACQVGYSVTVLIELTAGVAAASTEEAIAAMAEAGAVIEGTAPAGALLAQSLGGLVGEDR